MTLPKIRFYHETLKFGLYLEDVQKKTEHTPETLAIREGTILETNLRFCGIFGKFYKNPSDNITFDMFQGVAIKNGERVPSTSGFQWLIFTDKYANLFTLDSTSSKFKFKKVMTLTRNYTYNFKNIELSSMGGPWREIDPDCKFSILELGTAEK